MLLLFASLFVLVVVTEANHFLIASNSNQVTTDINPVLRGNVFSTESRITKFQRNWFAAADKTCSGKPVVFYGLVMNVCQPAGTVGTWYKLGYKETSKEYTITYYYYSDASCSDKSFKGSSTQPIYVKNSCVYSSNYDLYYNYKPASRGFDFNVKPGVIYNYYENCKDCKKNEEVVQILYNELNVCLGSAILTKCDEKSTEYYFYAYPNCTGARTFYTQAKSDTCVYGAYVNADYVSYTCN